MLLRAVSDPRAVSLVSAAADFRAELFNSEPRAIFIPKGTDEAVADVAMAATGSVFYVAPPGEDEVEAPAPAAPEKDFGPETLSEGQLADMFDSI